jgi:hypothetical protein
MKRRAEQHQDAHKVTQTALGTALIAFAKEIRRVLVTGIKQLAKQQPITQDALVPMFLVKTGMYLVNNLENECCN